MLSGARYFFPIERACRNFFVLVLEYKFQGNLKKLMFAFIHKFIQLIFFSIYNFLLIVNGLCVMSNR